jgi:hypothetical protein
MDYVPDRQVEAIRKMFPDLDEDQLREAKAILDDYCEILYRMFTRLENEKEKSQNDKPSRTGRPEA